MKVNWECIVIFIISYGIFLPNILVELFVVGIFSLSTLHFTKHNETDMFVY